MPLLYEVNLKIKKNIETSFGPWLKEHMKQMLQMEGFQKATLYTEQLEAKSSEGFLFWTIHYEVVTREALQKYLEQNAAQMRKKGKDKFPEGFSASRRILSSHSL